MRYVLHTSAADNGWQARHRLLWAPLRQPIWGCSSGGISARGRRARLAPSRGLSEGATPGGVGSVNAVFPSLYREYGLLTTPAPCRVSPAIVPSPQGSR